MFYFFYITAIISSIFMVSCVNPINAVLFLISVFISIAMIFLLLNLEFLGFIFIIIYVGAIAVLFLFIVMMINIKKIERNINTYLTVGFIVFLLLLCQIILLLFNFYFEYSSINLNLNNFFEYLNLNYLDEVVRIIIIKNFGIILFFIRPFLIYLAGLVLLMAMLGSIYLTNIKRGFSVKKQFNQLSKTHHIHHVNIY
ncbi:MAG: NADH-quinone oxidoreductase subunit J [Candidatus Sericytochromatia bacterium]